MKGTGTLLLVAIVSLALMAGCVTPTPTETPANTAVEEPEKIDAVATSVAEVSGAVDDLASMVARCCEEDRGDPGGHVIERATRGPEEESFLAPVAAQVALYRVESMTPDPTGSPHVEDDVHCFTMESMTLTHLAGWQDVPIADPNTAPGTLESAGNLRDAYTNGPTTNPAMSDAMHGGRYGWLAQPGCYYVLVTDPNDPNVTYPSPIVGVVAAGDAFDVKDLNFCLTNARWGSDKLTICDLP